MERRNFIQKSGLGTAAILGLAKFSIPGSKARATTPGLQITKIETVRFNNAHE